MRWAKTRFRLHLSLEVPLSASASVGVDAPLFDGLIKPLETEFAWNLKTLGVAC